MCPCPWTRPGEPNDGSVGTVAIATEGGVSRQVTPRHADRAPPDFEVSGIGGNDAKVILVRV